MNSVCVDTLGSYECHCKMGYLGGYTPGFLCHNINECEDKRLIHCDAKRHDCVDTVGSYFCTCKEGYNTYTYPLCEDYDECELNAHSCHNEATCVNSAPGYFCVCNSGFEDTSRDFEYFNKDGTVATGRECERPKSLMVINGRQTSLTVDAMRDQSDACTDVNCPLNSFCRESDASFMCDCKDRVVHKYHSSTKL